MGTPHSPNTLTNTIYSELERKNTRKAEKLIRKGQLHLYSPSHPLYQSIHGPRNTKLSSRKLRNFLQRSPKLIGRTLGNTHIHITTSFCHPITFNYVPDPLLKSPCSWCDNPFYGLWGLASTSGPRKVEGFYYPNGGGFEEVFGGFSELGYSRSVMCIACTYARVRITQCPTHRLRALDVQTGEFDLDVLSEEKWGKAVKAYESGDMQGAELVRSAKWCSVCPAAAALKCCSPQLFDENGEPITAQQHTRGEGYEGCGLLLCEACAELLRKLIRGGARTGGRQLDHMVAEVKRNRWRFTEGVRADAEFLTSGGELLRRIGEGMGASEGMMDVEGEMKVLKVRGEGGWIAGGRAGEGARKRDRDGWMSWMGKAKESGSASTSGDFKPSGKTALNGTGGGRESMNGSVSNRKGLKRPASSTTSSPNNSHHNTNVKTERRISNGTSSSQSSFHTHPTARTHNQSIAAPSSRSSYSASSNNHRTSSSSSHSHSHSAASRNMHITGGHSGLNASGSNGYVYGPGKRGIKRERVDRGEIMFGGFLKERKEDVEKAFRGQMGVIDLTEDD